MEFWCIPFLYGGGSIGQSADVLCSWQTWWSGHFSMVLTDSILDLRVSLDFGSGRDLTVLPRSPNEPRQCSLAITKSL
jgi:hypothetical protein